MCFPLLLQLGDPGVIYCACLCHVLKTLETKYFTHFYSVVKGTSWINYSEGMKFGHLNFLLSN